MGSPLFTITHSCQAPFVKFCVPGRRPTMQQNHHCAYSIAQILQISQLVTTKLFLWPDQASKSLKPAVARAAREFRTGERPRVKLAPETTMERVVVSHAGHHSCSAFLLETEGVGEPAGRTSEETLCTIFNQTAGHRGELFVRCDGCYRQVAELAPS